MLYLTTQNKYISNYYIYTPEELEFSDKLEKEWNVQKQNLRLHELLTIFPEAKTRVKKILQENINEDKERVAYS